MERLAIDGGYLYGMKKSIMENNGLIMMMSKLSARY